MSRTLYEEAIEAAEQIKNATEENIKKKLVESLSPRIKEIVEKSFLEKTLYENKESKKNKKEVLSDCNESEEDNNIDDESYVDTDAFFADESDEVVEGMSREAKKLLEKLSSANISRLKLENRLKTLKKNIFNFKKALIIAESSTQKGYSDTRLITIYKNLLSELKFIKNNSIIKKDKSLFKEYLQINKELTTMSRRRNSRRGFLNESLDDLLEMHLFEEDDAEVDDAEVDDDEVDDDEVDDDDDLDLFGAGADDDSGEGSDGDLTSALEQISKIAKDALGDDDTLELDLGEEGEEGEEGEGEDMKEESVFYELDEMYEGDDEDLESESYHVEESRRRRRGEKVFEIDENMLRREVNRMRRIREGEAKDMASHFGGGALGKEMFVDFDEGDLNVHAGHLGREDVPTPKVEAALRNAARKNRMLEGKMKQYKNVVNKMKAQLSEMNLFNAKLLYANKLMQNRDLSIKQQRHIVESLDEAKNLGEAKILFESLSKTMTKSGNTTSGRTTMSESVNRNTAGYSSRPVQSAQPINESVALDRWATLAGIKR